MHKGFIEVNKEDTEATIATNVNVHPIAVHEPMWNIKNTVDIILFGLLL